jgi:hypothetical protein
VEAGAADTSIQCLEYSPARREAAICGLGARVRVWSLTRPRQPRLALVLDHGQPPLPSQQQQKHVAATPQPPDVGSSCDPHYSSDMQWLTRSDLPGLGQRGSRRPGAPPLPDIVAEAIATAAEDVPQVTQARWSEHSQLWITAADDQQLRLWGPDGRQHGAFASKGGSCRCACVHTLISMYAADTNTNARRSSKGDGQRRTRLA